MEILLRESKYVHVLHITRFAQWLQEKKCSINVPYLLTMGGTDVHIDIKQGKHTETTIRLMEKAKYITVFNLEAKNILAELEPRWEDKLVIIPQAVFLPNGADLTTYQQSEQKQQRKDTQLHILLPAGLRQVKDVLHLLDAWKHLAQTIPGLRVSLIGEALERQVLEDVKQAAREHSFLHYHGAVPFEEMIAMYREADVVINTSREEGQPTAICEAMALGIPVIVRDNPGNRSVVTHGRTGLVYQTQAEFISCIEQLITQPSIVEQMIETAQQFILRERSVEQEIKAYITLLKA